MELFSDQTADPQVHLHREAQRYGLRDEEVPLLGVELRDQRHELETLRTPGETRPQGLFVDVPISVSDCTLLQLLPDKVFNQSNGLRTFTVHYEGSTVLYYGLTSCAVSESER